MMMVRWRLQLVATVGFAESGHRGAARANLRSVIRAVWACCRCQSGRWTWWWGQRWEAEDRSAEKTSPARRDRWGSRTSSAAWSRRWLPLREQGREGPEAQSYFRYFGGSLHTIFKIFSFSLTLIALNLFSQSTEMQVHLSVIEQAETEAKW